MSQSYTIVPAFHAFTDICEQEQIPTDIEANAHLKLMKSFQNLRKTVIVSSDAEAGAKSWQVFVTNAARRFIIYVSALKCYMFPNSVEDYSSFDEIKMYMKACAHNRHSIEIMSDHLPPLDIVMVWHAFALNPRAFYDTFLRNDFLTFAFIPFPLRLLSYAIRDETFEYLPNVALVQGFHKILNAYAVSMEYEFNGPFIANISRVPVFCPACHQMIHGSVPLSNETNTGFADAYFKISDATLCCGFHGKIHHDQLRRRQLYADLSDRRTLPYIFKYFSLLWGYGDEEPLHFDAATKSESIHVKDLLKNLSLEAVLLGRGPFPSRKKLQMVGRNYVTFNLIYLTIPRRKTIQIHEDLVGCVMRQGRFIDTMNTINLIRNPNRQALIAKSIMRYQKFVNLMLRSEKPPKFVPTIDIDFIWHTHILSSYLYFRCCSEKGANSVMREHDDKIEDTLLDKSFRVTSKLYYSEYGHDYSECACWYCEMTRLKSRGMIKRIFTFMMLKENIALTNSDSRPDNCLTHVSTHSAISIPSDKAAECRQELKAKYKNRLTPWSLDKKEETSFALQLFVASPIYPVNFPSDIASLLFD